MADVNLKNLARMTVSSSGTGTITLNTAVTGFLTFDLAGCSTAAAGSVVRYAIADTTNSEFAYGTYTSSSLTLTRGSSTTGMKSTNSDSPINMSNAAQVFITDSYADHPWVVDTTGSPATMTVSQNGTTSAIVSNTNSGAAASARFIATSDAGSLTLAANSTANGAAGQVAWNGSGGLFLDASNAAGGIFMRTGAVPTTAITVSSTQGVSLAGTLGVTGGTTLSGALTYGGVTLNNAVTGTGNMVLSSGPTFTGTTVIGTLSLTTVGAHIISGAITYGGVALNNAVTGTGNMVLSASPTFTGTILAAGATLSGALQAAGITSTTSLVAQNGVLYLNAPGTVAIEWQGGGNRIYTAQNLYLGNSLTVTNYITSLGTYSRAGASGGVGVNVYNINYTGPTADLWIDSTNLGAITTSCDYRIKKSVGVLSSTWDKVKALRPISYTQAQYGIFKEDDIERWGFIAHELQEVILPSAASGVKDQENLIQSPNMLAIVAALTKALQEAMERIEALESAA